MLDPVQFLLMQRQNLNVPEEKPSFFSGMFSLALKFQNESPLQINCCLRLFNAALDFGEAGVIGCAHFPLGAATGPMRYKSCCH